MNKINKINKIQMRITYLPKIKIKIIITFLIIIILKNRNRINIIVIKKDNKRNKFQGKKWWIKLNNYNDERALHLMIFQ